MRRALVAATALAGVLLTAVHAGAATPSPFSGETVFGDSLSDGGNISIVEGLPNIMRFTTNPGLTTVEDVGAFFGIQPTPSLLGGTNYAYGGAGVLTNSPGTPSSIPTLTAQVDGYLAAGQKLSPTELYTVLGGANDIFYHSTAYAAGQFVAAHSAGSTPAQIAFLTALVEQTEHITNLETQQQALDNVSAAATQQLSLISALQKAGAKYIVVVNLPDVGRTPSAVGEDSLVPGTSAEVTSLSQAFNSTLNAGLAHARLGIIPVNTFAFFNEILADPSRYGFVNSTVQACTTVSSLNCTPQTLVAPNAASTYVFADSVHPTTATHALFAQVVESEILAPQQLSLLAEAPLSALDVERGAISRELLDDDISGQTGVRLFASGGYTHRSLDAQRYTPGGHGNDGLATAGVDWRPNLNLSLGAELTGGEASTRLNGQLRSFDTDEIMGRVFAQYLWKGFYLNDSIGAGTLNYHGIDRAFALGPTNRTETGDTSGSTFSAGLEGGYWFGSARLHTGPVAGLDYDRVHVDGYGEKSGDSTAMRFEDQNREALTARAGWRVQASVPLGQVVLQPYAEAAYAYDADARTRDVTAGLTTMAGEFAIPGYSPDREWAELQAGLQGRMGPWGAYAAYQGRVAGSSQEVHSGVVGISYNF